MLLSYGKPLSNPTTYRTIVGALQYLCLTRLDVSFTVNKLSQFMHHPMIFTGLLLNKCFNIYMHVTLHQDLLIRRDSSDADWAGDKDSYRSATGYIGYLGANPIAWNSKCQRTLLGHLQRSNFVR